MPSISQGLVFTTAMVLSSTVLYLTFHWHKTTPPFHFHGNSNSLHSNKQTLRSCLYSSIQEKRGERNMKRKKKRVQFAENVMEPRKKSEDMKKEQRKSSKCSHNKTSEDSGIPVNRIVLYNGILRNKVKVLRMSSSY